MLVVGLCLLACFLCFVCACLLVFACVWLCFGCVCLPFCLCLLCIFACVCLRLIAFSGVCLFACVFRALHISRYSSHSLAACRVVHLPRHILFIYLCVVRFQAMSHREGGALGDSGRPHLDRSRSTPRSSWTTAAKSKKRLWFDILLGRGPRQGL